MEITIDGKKFVEEKQEPRYKVGDRVFVKRAWNGDTEKSFPFNSFGTVREVHPDAEQTPRGRKVPYLVSFKTDSWWIAEADIDHERTAQGEEEPTLSFEFEWNGRTWVVDTGDGDLNLAVRDEKAPEMCHCVLYIHPNMDLEIPHIKVELP